MKRKLLSALLCTAMAVSCLAGCGGSSGGSDADDSSDSTETEEEPVISTFGDADGTHMELWTFADVHASLYGEMAEKWNEQNPDKTVEVTVTVYPYADMHDKLLMSLQAGSGAPDICDVELGQFPNVVAGEEEWLYPLDDAAEPYIETMVTSRMETYMGEDGHYYGAPFHVGATVMYYNMAALEEVGITQEEVDAVVTWDDYQALGEKYIAAVGADDKYFTAVDTGGTDWLWIAMAENGDDWTGGLGGTADVQLDSVKSMLEMQQSWLDSGVATIAPDGQTDTEGSWQAILDHTFVSFPKALWYMSRFTQNMEDEKGNWYIAKCPVFEEGQPSSVGIGGTGTVVTQTSENKELAAEWLCYAKMSEEGENAIWQDLGFDVCNTALCTDDAFAHDETNQYNTFFRNYPYDVLNSIKDEIGKISTTKISPTINEHICTYTLNEVFEEGMSVDEALQEAQDAVDLEQE